MLVIFSGAMFVSATLLFLVQPMFTKMVLPLLGGTPAVWNTCMVFYQAALLAGYLYAHAATRVLGVRRQAVFHLVLLLPIILTLPIGMAQGWTPPAAGNPIPWLLMVLLVSVGLPFFVISTTAPMLQKWFAHTRHAAAQDPYFLYGASNLGSMLALLGYPLLVEPYLRLADQARVWAGGYGVLVGLITVCAVMLWRSPAAPTVDLSPRTMVPSPLVASSAPVANPLNVGRRLWWILLAFAPSSLLLGVTSYLSTDIAAVPLLWVVPLAIYLLTFVLVFSRKPILSHRLMVLLQPFLVIPLAVLFFLRLETGIWMLFPVHLAAFFLMAMVCHGELMKYRPGPSHLTEFYLWMSVGGVLGGLFNALVAPTTFQAVIEYPLVIVVACLLRPSLTSEVREPHSRLLDYLLPLALAVLLGGLVRILFESHSSLRVMGIIILACLGGVYCYSFRHRPLRFGLGVGAIMLAGVLFIPAQGEALYTVRNFFGILQVKQDPEGHYHLLTHGTTLHGAQSLDPGRRREPLTYYHRTGPLGQLFAAYSGKDAKGQVAVIGLGTGTIACYGCRGQHFIFYEINPAVESIARNPRFFTFLEDCPAKVDIVLGDARLSLRQAPPSGYNLIILDAFSSDAIPIHLVTREALRLYLAKLKEGGILAFHISNNYLDLRPVLGKLASDAGLTCLEQTDQILSQAEKKGRKSPSDWVVMARKPEDLAKLAGDPRWLPLSGMSGGVVWTDDFSNILAVFKWRSIKLDETTAPILSAVPRGRSNPSGESGKLRPGEGAGP